MIRKEFVSWMHSACELEILFVMDEDDAGSGAVMHTAGFPWNLGPSKRFIQIGDCAVRRTFSASHPNNAIGDRLGEAHGRGI